MGILEDAKSLGLNNYEAKVYLALFEREFLTVNEIAKISRVPRARIYDILESLMAGGLATLISDKVNKYRAVEPEVFSEKLIEQLEKKHLKQKETVEKAILTFKKKFEDRSDIFQNDGPRLNYIEIIRDINVARSRMIQLVKKAKQEILYCIKPPFLFRPKTAHYEPSQNEPTRIDLAIQVKNLIQIPTEREEIELWSKRMDANEKDARLTRLLPELPMKMMVLDERIVFMYLKDPIMGNSAYTTQIIDQPELAKTMKLAFETLWAQAHDSSLLKKLLEEGE